MPGVGAVWVGVREGDSKPVDVPDLSWYLNSWTGESTEKRASRFTLGRDHEAYEVEKQHA